jgi:hypothetical protein
MLRSFRRISIATVVCSGLLAAANAQAALITFSAGGEREPVRLNNGLDAIINARPRTATVNLTPGVPQTVLLNDVAFDVDLLNTAAGTDTLNQTLTITSPASTPTSRSLAQGIAVNITASVFGTTATATIAPSSGVTFNLGNVGTLTVTPQGGGVFDTNQVSSSFENSAQFLLTAPIPEPATGMMLLAGAGLLASRRPRRA